MSKTTQPPFIKRLAMLIKGFGPMPFVILLRSIIISIFVFYIFAPGLDQQWGFVCVKQNNTIFILEKVNSVLEHY